MPRLSAKGRPNGHASGAEEQQKAQAEAAEREAAWLRRELNPGRSRQASRDEHWKLIEREKEAALGKPLAPARPLPRPWPLALPRCGSQRSR